MRKRRLLSTVLALTAVLTISGCGSSSASETGNYKASGAADAGQTDEAYAQDDYGTTELATEEAAVDTGVGGSGTTATPIQSQRKLTKDVSISARTEKFDDTVAAIEKAVKDAGGYISSSQLSTGSYYGSSSSGRSKSYEIEIPADKLDSFLGQAEDLMNIYDQSEQVTDITDTYNEAQSELDSLNIEEESLNKMLEEATKVEDTIQIQDRLAYIHMRQNELTNMLNGYDKEIAYSTVSLYLNEVSVEEENSNTVWGRISYGFKSSLHAVGSFFVNLFVFILAASPVLIILAVIIILIVVLVRRGHKKKAEKKAKARNVPMGQPTPQKKQPSESNQAAEQTEQVPQSKQGAEQTLQVPQSKQRAEQTLQVPQSKQRAEQTLQEGPASNTKKD